MKMKSTLWALAFACAAVSCSDDFEDPNKGGEGPGTGGNGAKAMMNVTISTDAVTKAMTKASDDPEKGDGNEEGSLDESKVTNLNVFLFEATGYTDDDNKFYKDNAIVAKGFANIDNTEDSDHPTDHQYQASVEIEFSKDEYAASGFAGKTFGVIAVVNTGNILNKFDLTKEDDPVTISDLANCLETTIYNTTNNNDFRMSSHMLKDEKGCCESYVTFPANTDAQDIPTATVFVERLAAKIRIAPHVDVANFTYSVGADRIRLDSVAIINQLTSGSYLLKRATKEKAAELTDNSADSILIDEDYAGSGATATANFVLDPWTYGKLQANVFKDDGTGTMPTYQYGADPAVSLAYGNAFNGRADYTALFNAIKATSKEDEKFKALYQEQTALTDNVLLAYTMENTTNVANSKKGFSTGALFKATYFAAEVMEIQGDGMSVEPVKTSFGNLATSAVTDDAPTFYTYGVTEMKFAGLKDIFAYKLAQQVTSTSNVEGYYFYKDLAGYYGDSDSKSCAFDTVKVASFKASKTYAEIGTSLNDPFGYLEYLKGHLDKVTAPNANDRLEDAVEYSDDGITTDIPLKNFDEYVAALDDAVKYESVKAYENGTCYYLYWIRHENNGINSLMGPMEFAIVRNNIYDLSVKEISGLGLSGVDVPDPKDDDEDGTAKMNVVVKVRNWVVRKNADIIL